MKLIVILFLTFTCLSTVNGQIFTDKLESTWGENIKLGKRAYVDNVLGSDESGCYVLMTEPKGLLRFKYTIKHFRDDLSLANEAELKLPKQYKDFSINSVIYFANKIYVIGFSYNKSAKTRLMKAFEVSKKTLTASTAKPIDLADMSFEFKKNTGNINYSISKESKAIAIRIDLPYEEGKVDRTLYKVYDDEFNLIWENEFENTLNGDGVLLLDDAPVVDDEGNIFSYDRYFEDLSSAADMNTKENRKALRRGEIESKSYLNILFKGAKEMISAEMDLDDFNMSSFVMTPLDNGNVAFTGLHTGDEYKGVKGAFYFEVDAAKGEIVNVKEQDFSENFVTQYWSVKAKAKAEKKAAKRERKGKAPIEPQLYDYKLREVLIKENGDMCMIAEQYYVRIVTSTYRDANGVTHTTTTYYYYYKDCILVNYKKDGNIDWIKKLPKRQTSTNDGGMYLSYYAFTDNNKVYMVFNDNAKNLNVDADVDANNSEDVEWLRWKDAVCALATIDNNGNIEREWMFNLKEEKVLSMPKVCAPLENGEHLMYMKRGKTTKFVKFGLTK